MWYMTSTDSTGRGLHSREVTFTFGAAVGLSVGRPPRLARPVFLNANVLVPPYCSHFLPEVAATCRASKTLHCSAKASQLNNSNPPQGPVRPHPRAVPVPKIMDGNTARRKDDMERSNSAPAAPLPSSTALTLTSRGSWWLIGYSNVLVGGYPAASSGRRCCFLPCALAFIFHLPGASTGTSR